MEAKLRQLMKHEGINSTRLAEILGIQASGISHIMSGRNKPSFDFLLKLLQRFPQINPDWLILDKGPMYRDEIKNKTGTTGSARHSGGASETSGGITQPPLVGHAPTPGGAGITVPSRELFGPDNNDIIPLGGHADGYSGGQSRPELNSKEVGMYRNSAGDYAPMHGENREQQEVLEKQPEQSLVSGGHTGMSATQPPVYQSGGLTRSISVERIVVFYKDKTFSEYKPE